MTKTPDMIFILDTNIEDLAVKESIKLNIPIVAIVDSNSNPTGINYPIPGNDDARRAINLYCELIKQTILEAQKKISKEEKENNTSGKTKPFSFAYNPGDTNFHNWYVITGTDNIIPPTKAIVHLIRNIPWTESTCRFTGLFESIFSNGNNNK